MTWSPQELEVPYYRKLSDILENIEIESKRKGAKFDTYKEAFPRKQTAYSQTTELS